MASLKGSVLVEMRAFEQVASNCESCFDLPAETGPDDRRSEDAGLAAHGTDSENLQLPAKLLCLIFELFLQVRYSVLELSREMDTLIVHEKPLRFASNASGFSPLLLLRSALIVLS